MSLQDRERFVSKLSRAAQSFSKNSMSGTLSSPSYCCIWQEMLGAEIHNLIFIKEMEANRKNKIKVEQGKHDFRNLQM